MNLQAPEKGSIWTDRNTPGYEIVVLEGSVDDMTDGGRKVVYADPDGVFVRSRTLASFGRIFVPKPKPIITEDVEFRRGGSQQYFHQTGGETGPTFGDHLGVRKIVVHPDGTWTGEWL